MCPVFPLSLVIHTYNACTSYNSDSLPRFSAQGNPLVFAFLIPEDLRNLVEVVTERHKNGAWERVRYTSVSCTMFRRDGDAIRYSRFVSWHSYAAYTQRWFLSFRVLFTDETPLIVSRPESHASVRPAGLSMNYGKRVHNSPVSHAFTRPSNRRRVRSPVGTTETATTECCLVSLIPLTRNYTHRPMTVGVPSPPRDQLHRSRSH